jgi:hypothetical protein
MSGTRDEFVGICLGHRALAEVSAAFALDAQGRGHLYTRDTVSAVLCFVTLADQIRRDPAASEAARHVAAGVWAVLAEDVPTDPGDGRGRAA